MYKFLSLVLIFALQEQGQASVIGGLLQSVKPIGSVVSAVGKPVTQAVNGLANGLNLSPVLDQLLDVVDPIEEAALCKLIPYVLVPIVDCTDPLQNITLLSGEIPNCFSDCVCVHGFNNGICQPSKIAPSGTACICSMEYPQNGDIATLNQFRTDVCAKNQVVQAAFNTLCGLDAFNNVFHGACNADCRCGHEMDAGICVRNGDVDTDVKGLCHCVNNSTQSS